ncbi:MAG: hypothetical protein IJW67_04205 [Blautia sp.]|nr:hypothetical protein [Blautia sp.]
MKKTIFMICLIGLAFSMTGCSLGDMVDQFVSAGDAPAEEITEAKPRVYMDEMKGILRDFTGDTLIISSDEKEYYFDISAASLECENGMITGDEITVIYEGRLSETDEYPDTSQVKVLKVVNDYRMHADPIENTTSGTIQELSPNRITIRLGDGRTILFPATGCKEYFSTGIRTDVNVTVHYLGEPDDSADHSETYQASHVKTVTISDVEPYAAPAQEQPKENSDIQAFQGVIQSLQTNILTVRVSGSKNSIALDLAHVPAFFPGGPMPGSKVTVSYQGEFNGSTLEGISLLSVTGEDPAALKEYSISFSVTGNVRSRTQNTVTILTTDGAFVTFQLNDVENNSTGGLETGSDIRVIFNPEENRTTNVYSCIRIEDA